MITKHTRERTVLTKCSNPPLKKKRIKIHKQVRQSHLGRPVVSFATASLMRRRLLPCDGYTYSKKYLLSRWRFLQEQQSKSVTAFPQYAKRTHGFALKCGTSAYCQKKRRSTSHPLRAHAMKMHAPRSMMACCAAVSAGSRSRVRCSHPQ